MRIKGLQRGNAVLFNILVFLVPCLEQDTFSEPLFPLDHNPPIRDLVSRFQAISPSPRKIPITGVKGTIPGGGHFQGIQEVQIKGKQYAAITGSSSDHSFLLLSEFTGHQARFTSILTLLPKPFKHAGGIQAVGDYLVFGIEDNSGKKASRVWIVETSHLLEAGIRPVIEIQRRGPYKRSTAGAVGMAKVRGRHYLVVASWDSETLDIYESNGRPLGDASCQFQLFETWESSRADKAGWIDPGYESYQNINVLVDMDERVFLAGFVEVDRTHRADLFSLDLDKRTHASRRLQKISSRVFQCDATTFRAGAGFVCREEGKLELLSISHRAPAIELFEAP